MVLFHSIFVDFVQGLFYFKVNFKSYNYSNAWKLGQQDKIVNWICLHIHFTLGRDFHLILDMNIYAWSRDFCCHTTARSTIKIGSILFHEKKPLTAKDYLKKNSEVFVCKNRHLFQFTSHSFIFWYQIPWATFIFIHK